MTSVLALTDWLAYLESEYLDRYVRGGGAAVKFAVTPYEADAVEASVQLRGLAVANGYVPMELNASMTKLHLIERVFFACSGQVPWSRLTDYALKRFATDEGFIVPSTVPAGTGFAQAVAHHSEMELDFVRQRLAAHVHAGVHKDVRMARDFRLAMSTLCQGRLTGAATASSEAELVEQWITGRLPRVSAVKHLGIFTKINRTNARLHFESMLHWLRVAHIPGTVMTIDVNRLLSTDRAAPGERYSRPALLEAYEVLRQFIDSIDDLEGLLVVVVGNEGLLDPDRKQRGVGAYMALRNRVYDEVRDHDHPNPASSLVRLSVGAP